jgi:hypothetical protein
MSFTIPEQEVSPAKQETPKIETSVAGAAESNRQYGKEQQAGGQNEANQKEPDRELSPLRAFLQIHDTLVNTKASTPERILNAAASLVVFLTWRIAFQARLTKQPPTVNGSINRARKTNPQRKQSAGQVKRPKKGWAAKASSWWQRFRQKKAPGRPLDRAGSPTIVLPDTKTKQLQAVTSRSSRATMIKRPEQSSKIARKSTPLAAFGLKGGQWLDKSSKRVPTRPRRAR